MIFAKSKNRQGIFRIWRSKWFYQCQIHGWLWEDTDCCSRARWWEKKAGETFPWSHTLLITQRQIQKYNTNTTRDTNIAIRYVAVRPKTFTNTNTWTKTNTNTKNSDSDIYSDIIQIMMMKMMMSRVIQFVGASVTLPPVLGESPQPERQHRSQHNSTSYKATL